MIKNRPESTGSLKLAIIRIDGGTQMRADLNEDVVAEYAQIIKDGGDFPPIVVYFDGSKYWLADGFHRYHAYRAALAEEISADVRAGTKREAIFHSVSANVAHGLRRTNADKRKAVETLLSDKEWGMWSDREIARACHVGHPLVASVRADITGSSSSESRAYTTRHGTPAVMNTANIGKSKSSDTSAPAEADVTVPISEGGADAAPVTDTKAEKDARRAAIDQWHAQHKATVPDHIRQAQAATEAATEAAIAKRRETVGADADDGLTDEQHVAELREHIKVVEAENAELKAENVKFEAMRVQYEQGGFEKVVAGKDEEIRVLRSSLEVESADKATLAGQAKFWKKQAKALGWKPDVKIVGTEGLRDA